MVYHSLPHIHGHPFCSRHLQLCLPKKIKKNLFTGLFTSLTLYYMGTAAIHFIGQMKRYTGNRNITPLILKLDTRWSCQRIRTGKKPFEIILLQTTGKENNWKTEETLERAAVTLGTERIRGSNPWCLWWWWWWSPQSVSIKVLKPCDYCMHH